MFRTYMVRWHYLAGGSATTTRKFETRAQADAWARDTENCFCEPRLIKAIVVAAHEDVYPVGQPPHLELLELPVEGPHWTDHN